MIKIIINTFLQITSQIANIYLLIILVIINSEKIIKHPTFEMVDKNSTGYLKATSLISTKFTVCVRSD